MILSYKSGVSDALRSGCRDHPAVPPGAFTKHTLLVDIFYYFQLANHRSVDSSSQIKSIPDIRVKYRTSEPVLLDCPQCQHFVPGGHIDMSSGEVGCPNCGHTFALENEIRKDPLRRPEIVMPKGIEVLKLRASLEIDIDWYHAAPKRSIATIISGSFFWNLLLIPLVVFLALSGDFFFILFFGGHLMTGLALMVYLLAMLVNKTSIAVDKSGIRIRHRPVPVFNKAQDIPVENIAQLYVSRYTERFSNKKSKGVQAYALSAILKNNKVMELVKGLDRESQLYLEQEIETHLGIVDRRVRGEVTRNQSMDG